MPKAQKGSQFERDLCRMFSLWWTGGERDDVFWRTPGSGAMATTRTKKDLQTSGLYGDMTSTDPAGQRLIDLVTFEFKRGYNTTHATTLLDVPPQGATQEFQKFLDKTINSAQEAGTPHWALVHRRDRRQALIYMGPGLFGAVSTSTLESCPRMVLYPPNWKNLEVGQIVGLRLGDFFQFADPFLLH